MNIEKVWKDKTEIIRKFIERNEKNKQLCSEIAYILKKRLDTAEIEYSTITNRTKTLNSFLEKLDRKSYSDPFEEITDFAGVRIVYLYQKDLDNIEKQIKSEFNIVERVDKLNDKGADKFGYGALHFIIKLGKSSKGARYDDLKNLKCEIQVRTVLQDAWAIIDHHLVYKKESEIPSTLQRKLNSLAGLFETADNQFEIIRNEREEYLSELDKSSKGDKFLENELNLDTYIKYLEWKFPDIHLKNFDKQPEVIFNNISNLNINSLRELDDVVNNFEGKALEIKKEIEKEFEYEYFKNEKMPSSLLVSTLLQINYPNHLEKADIPYEVKDFLHKRYVVK